MGVKGEVIKTKGIDNILNRIIVENFLNLEKIESPRCRKLAKPSYLIGGENQTFHNKEKLK
jgi:hypothetical protein